jgi:hypothetical protein
LSARDVSVSLSSETVVEYFIGTRAAFGAFHADTIVVDSAGGRRTVSSLCEMEDPWSLTWESCVHGGGLMRLELGVDELWNAFATVALVGNADAMIVKKFQGGLARDKRFIRVIRSDLEGRLAATGAAGVAEQIKSLFLTDPSLAYIERTFYRLAMWLATSLQAIEDGYCLDYDALQHTSVVNVRLDCNIGQIESLRTAFAAGTAGRSTVEWTDRTWNPISSGFILDGYRHEGSSWIS